MLKTIRNFAARHRKPVWPQYKPGPKTWTASRVVDRFPTPGQINMSNVSRFRGGWAGKSLASARQIAGRYGSAAGLGVGSLLTLGALGAKAFMGMSSFRENVIRGLYPGSVMPSSEGRYGYSTHAQAPSAGISGMKFTYRK